MKKILLIILGFVFLGGLISATNIQFVDKKVKVNIVWQNGGESNLESPEFNVKFGN